MSDLTPGARKEIRCRLSPRHSDALVARADAAGMKPAALASQLLAAALNVDHAVTEPFVQIESEPAVTMSDLVLVFERLHLALTRHLAVLLANLTPADHLSPAELVAWARKELANE